MSHRDLVFVLPPDSHLISGGNIYNRELTAAVRRQRAIDEVSVAEWQRLVASGAAGVFFIDTLILEEFLRHVPERPAPGQRFVLVVHHLPSLEPGVDAGDPSLAVEQEVLPRFDGFLATSPYTAASSPLMK